MGWCLSESGYSAQLDAGAYSYGRVNTRYRAGYKKTPTDTNVLEAEVFDDPVWGQKTTNNKLALGATCVVSGSHVTFAVAMNKDNTHVFGLGGNQGDRVRVSAYRKGSVQSSVFPIEYTIYIVVFYYSVTIGSLVNIIRLLFSGFHNPRLF